MPNPHNPRNWHRAEADRFADLIDGVADWDVPTPVAGWSALDVVAHVLVHWPGFFAMGGVALPAADPGDLAGSFWRQAVAIDGLCADGPRLACEFTGPDGFRGDLGTAVGLYCTDLFVHGWDLARATAQDDGLDERTAGLLLAGMQAIGGQLRTLGQYGPEIEVAPDAPVAERLIGFLGRDPYWRPAG